MARASDSDPAFASIEEVARLFRRRELSPVELAKLMLERIAGLNPKLNAYITVTAETAMAQAKKAEAELFGPRTRKGHRDRGPLHGIPISLKDNIDTAGIRTTGGSNILRDFVPPRDAPVAAALKQAGTVLLGKTNMHEFAYGVTSNNPHYGPVHNPWDTARIAGGSSGGSAAAVAAGLCYGSIGTDTGGSIRIPAALCGVVGLKPGVGRVSTEGVIALSHHLDFVGPLARTAQDTTLLLEPILVRGKGERCIPAVRKRGGDSRIFRLGLPSEFFLDLLADEVREVFEAAMQTFRELGAKTKEVVVPLLGETENAGNQIAWAEATHYHQQAGWYPQRAAEYGEDVRMRLEMGTKVVATAYLEALELREKFIREFHLALTEARLDAIAVPTTPIAAPLIGEEAVKIGAKELPTRALLLRANRPANLAGVPAISVPCGFTHSGLPVGLQLIGALTHEHLLLHVAKAFQQATDWHLRHPPA